VLLEHTRDMQGLAPAPSAIWWRQLVPSATISASGAARTAGSRLSSAICMATAWCLAS
jgi:hypothetical protein